MADFQFGLNTSTIRPAGLLEKIRIARAAGYDSIELWIKDVEEHVAKGGSTAEVARALDDAGLARPSMISIRNWCAQDRKQFDAALTVAKKQLDVARELGVKRIVAGPPREKVDLGMASDRYAEILEESIEHGVPASLEFLGFSAGINTLTIAWQVCSATGKAEATITADAWHMFRGGSPFESLDAVPADHLSIMHWNDAPARPPRAEQGDEHRVYPGDGVLNLADLAARLRVKPWTGCLSLELFNPAYWKEDLLKVAKVGLEKMKRSISQR